MNGGFLRKGWESLRQDGYSLPPSRGKVPPQGADEGGYRGCGGHRTGGWGHPPLRRVTTAFVGAAVPSGPSTTYAPPWSPSSVTAAPCHLLPCGAKALAVLTSLRQTLRRSPHPSWASPMPPFPRGRLFISCPGSGCRGGYHPPGVPCYGTIRPPCERGLASPQGDDWRIPTQQLPILRPSPHPSRACAHATFSQEKAFILFLFTSAVRIHAECFDRAGGGCSNGGSGAG